MRVISGIIGLPVIVLLVWLGGWWLAGMMAVVAVLGQIEFYRATSPKIGRILGVTTGFFYVSVLLSAVVFTREWLGIFYVWLIFLAAWGCDTGAYFAGKAFGRRKLAPKLSPNKTVAGAVGGIVAAGVLVTVYVLVWQLLVENGLSEALRANSYEWPPLYVFPIFGAIAAVLGQAGDLSASAIKRKVGIKDFGGSIPGHGGILDRFDSILFVAPFALVFFLLIW